jgi:hypothetical protein
VTGVFPVRFPHSGIPGSQPACGSPGLFAACHALLRPLVPRHPPCALYSLTVRDESILRQRRMHPAPLFRSAKRPSGGSLYLCQGSEKSMWTRTDLNRRPPACKAGALPTELRALLSINDGSNPPVSFLRLVGLRGLEPRTSPLSGVRSAT